MLAPRKASPIEMDKTRRAQRVNFKIKIWYPFSLCPQTLSHIFIWPSVVHVFHVTLQCRIITKVPSRLPCYQCYLQRAGLPSLYLSLCLSELVTILPCNCNVILQRVPLCYHVGNTNVICKGRVYPLSISLSVSLCLLPCYDLVLQWGLQ